MNKKLVLYFALLSLIACSTRAQDGQVLSEDIRYDETNADQELHIDWNDWNVGLPDDAVPADATAADAAPEGEKDPEQEFHVDWINWDVGMPVAFEVPPVDDTTTDAAPAEDAEKDAEQEFHVDWTNWEVAVPESEPAAESSSNTSLRPNSGN